jgi:integrase
VPENHVSWDRHQFRDFLPYPQDQRRLPTVLSREEVSRLINAGGTLFRRTLFMTLYGTGMRRSELAHLKVGDIDSQRMKVRSSFRPSLSGDLPKCLAKSATTVGSALADVALDFFPD